MMTAADGVCSVGILGGSFNPVHLGHTMVAAWLANFTDRFDQVWLMLTPSNPLKGALPGATDAQRLDMLRLAVDSASKPGRLRVCDAELTLPRPSYTIHTLRHLAATHPHCRFSLIIGSDNWAIFDRWHQAQNIISEFGVTVYPRPGYPMPADSELPAGVTTVHPPQVSLSSTMLRQALAEGRSVAHLVDPRVEQYISRHALYSSPLSQPLHGNETQQ